MALYDDLEATDEQLLAGKKALADALLQVGITAVEPNPNNPDSYETFQSYADKIKRLMISNSMILEFAIPEEGFENLTKYKRTLVLPMSGVSINDIAISIINSDTGYTSSATNSTLSTLDDEEAVPTATDAFGNVFTSGSYVAETDSLDMAKSEFLRKQAELTNTPMPLANEVQYSFTVDWGDGSPVQEFVSFEESMDAVTHTYERPGTYDVSINGVYTYFSNLPGWSGYIIVDGEYFLDRDGSPVYYSQNYFTRAYLTKVIAWGNTQLSETSYAFTDCTKLTTIPMYDTTDSFSRLRTGANFFLNAGILSIPFDSNTNRGLFSNAVNLETAHGMFQRLPHLSEPIPEKLLDGCGKLTDIGNLFMEDYGLTGSIPSGIFGGLSGLTHAEGVFYSCTGLTGPIPEGLLSGSTQISDISLMFNSCIQLSGTAPAGIVGSECREMATAFSKIRGLTAIADDFFPVMNDETDVEMNFMFSESSVQSVQSGLFDGFSKDRTGWVNALGMFWGSQVREIPDTLFEETNHFFDCRGMFGGCSGLTSACPEFPADGLFDTYDGVKKWLGVFGGCTGMTGFNAMPAEFGGDGARLFQDRKVGMIYLENGDFVEVKDFAWDDTNRPLGFCYRSDGFRHLMCAFHYYYSTWLSSPLDVERWESADNPVPTGATNVHNTMYKDDFGLEWTEALMAWDFYVSNPASINPVKQCAQEREASNVDWYVPTLSEVVDMIGVSAMLNRACQVIVERGGQDPNAYYGLQMRERMWSVTRIWPASNWTWTSDTGYSQLQSVAYTGCYMRPCFAVPA